MEGAATTVYATGGRGNTRLITWEGEKTLTFTVEDALLSPLGFAILSGAGLFKGADSELVHVHQTSPALVDSNGVIDLSEALENGESICPEAPLFVMVADEDGSLTGEMIENVSLSGAQITLAGADKTRYANKSVFCDYYIVRNGSTVSELQIDAANFAGYYYVEASTLFRRQIDGKDLPAEITFPNVKIQSNFTFTMASTGDPSTFTFTMDAMPGYTYFDKTKKVLCVMQIVEEIGQEKINTNSVMDHINKGEHGEVEDSTATVTEITELAAVVPAYNSETRTITWEAVDNAMSYEIEYDTTEVETRGTSYVVPADVADDTVITIKACRGTLRSEAKTVTV